MVRKQVKTVKRSRGIPKNQSSPRPHLGSTKIIGRDEEKTQILTFFKTTTTLKKGGCLYISGSPGTGKTALVTELLHSFPFLTPPLYLNCMELTSPQVIFSTVYHHFFLSSKTKKKNVGQNDVELKLSRLKNPITIVLDEIDHLYAHHRPILYTLFEWSLKPNVALIGIANSLDLTDRLLPFLALKKCSPTCLRFPAYSVASLQAVLQARFPHWSSSVLHFIASKVASHSSDVRKALAMCHTAQQHAGDAPAVTLSHVSKSGPFPKLKHLPFPAQLALISLVKLPTAKVSKLAWYEHTRRVAETIGVPPPSVSELHEIAMHLETLGLIHLPKTKQPPTVSLTLSKEEITRGLASTLTSSSTTLHQVIEQVLKSIPTPC